MRSNVVLVFAVICVLAVANVMLAQIRPGKGTITPEGRFPASPCPSMYAEGYVILASIYSDEKSMTLVFGKPLASAYFVLIGEDAQIECDGQVYFRPLDLKPTRPWLFDAEFSPGCETIRISNARVDLLEDVIYAR